MIIKHPPWMANSNRFYYPARVNKPMMYYHFYSHSNSHHSEHNFKIIVVKNYVSLNRAIRYNQLRRYKSNPLKFDHPPYQITQFYKKQRYLFSRWYDNKLSQADNNLWTTMKTFRKIYKDRDERYDLYFTQGIIDPFGDEANTYMALTR